MSGVFFATGGKYESQADSFTWTRLTFYSAMITGWESIRKHQVNLLQSAWMDWKDKKFSKENLWIKINGDDAWAVCDNVWQWREGDQCKQFRNIQITICEKHDGRWKISFQAFVRDPGHLDVIDIQQKGMLVKCGFTFVGRNEDPEDSLVNRREIDS